jgi:hypothetical protein
MIVLRKELNMSNMMTRRHVNKRTPFASTIATLAIATLAAWLIYSIDAAKACSLPLGRRRFPDVD